jgi:hypothetical protein
MAMREMELAPFHEALRTDDADAAVREAAALLGVPGPKAVPKLGPWRRWIGSSQVFALGWPAANG